MTVYPNDVHAHLHSISQRVRKLLDEAPAAVKNANDAMRRVDGFGERGDSAGRGSSVTTSVESATIQTEVIEAELARLVACLVELGDPLRKVEQIVARWQPVVDAAAVEHTTCSGGPPHLEWSKPGCGNWVAYSILEDGSISERGDGLCDACRMRKSRHERKQADEAGAVYSTSGDGANW